MKCVVERRNHHLLDFCAAETLGRLCQRRKIELRRILLSQHEVNAKYVLPFAGCRQIDEEDFVEATFAQKLWRHAHQVVRCADHKDFRVFLLEPG